MATIEQEKASRVGLAELLGKLSKSKAEDYIRADKLGVAFSFGAAVPYIQRLLSLYAELAKCDLSEVSPGIIENHRALADSLSVLLKQVEQFDPTKSTIADRDRLIESLRTNYDGHWQRISPTLSYCLAKGGNIDEMQRQIAAAEDKYRESTTNALKNIGEASESASRLLKNMEDVAGKVGVNKHAKNFDNQAREHLFASRIWIVATVVFGILGAWLLYYLFVGGGRPPALSEKEVKTPLIVFEVITRLMAFSFASFGMYWAARNFASHRHNYVINCHRRNALATFQTFVGAAGEDEAIKGAVLLHAAQAIYSPQSSGYIEGVESRGHAQGVIEVLKTTVPKGE